MKTCTKCSETKIYGCFNKDSSKKDGFYSSCKQCSLSTVKKYHKTIKGLISKIYNSQKKSSRKRGHNMPDYKLEDLFLYLTNDELFLTLYEKWVSSDYDEMLIPSLDRIDNSVGYTFSNIRIVTWSDNLQNYYNRNHN